MSWKQKIAARLSNPPKLGNNKALKRQRGAAHGQKPFTSQSRALHFSVEPASWQNVLRDGCISQKNTPYRSHVSCHTPFFCRTTTTSSTATNLQLFVEVENRDLFEPTSSNHILSRSVVFNT